MNDAPLSRPVRLSEAPPDGLAVDIVADEAERAAVAAASADVVSIERFEARLRLVPQGRDEASVSGEVSADVTRTCGVTLEPFVERVREPVALRFGPPGDDAEDIDLNAEDPPDPIVGGAVDLGAVAFEFFTIGLDPHPRKPGAVFESPDGADGAESPFAALKRLARGEEKP